MSDNQDSGNAGGPAGGDGEYIKLRVVGQDSVREKIFWSKISFNDKLV